VADKNPPTHLQGIQGNERPKESGHFFLMEAVLSLWRFASGFPSSGRAIETRIPKTSVRKHLHQ